MDFTREPPAPVKRAAGFRPKHYSNFVLTVNTNYRPRDDADGQRVADQLYRVADVFLTPDGILSTLKFMVASGSARDISAIHVGDWAVEVGTHRMGQRVHLHAFVKIQHSTMLQFDVPTLKMFFQDRMCVEGAEYYTRGVKSIAAHAQWVRASEELISEYVLKGQRHGPAAAARADPAARREHGAGGPAAGAGAEPPAAGAV